MEGWPYAGRGEVTPPERIQQLTLQRTLVRYTIQVLRMGWRQRVPLPFHGDLQCVVGQYAWPPREFRVCWPVLTREDSRWLDHASEGFHSAVVQGFGSSPRRDR